MLGILETFWSMGSSYVCKKDPFSSWGNVGGIDRYLDILETTRIHESMLGYILE